LPEFCILGTPIIVAIAWWVRRRESNNLVLREWRSTVAGLGLTATSLNVLAFYGLLLWSKVLLQQHEPMATQRYWMVRNVLANWIAVPLVCVVLFGAVFGEGRVRAWLAASVLTGFLMWVPVAFL